MAYNNLQQLMGMGGAAYANIQQQSLQGRNPYQAGYPPNSQAMAGHPGYPGMVNSGYPQVAPSRTIPLHPNVKLQRLPFYDIHAELLKPAPLIAQGGNRFQEAQFTFVLSPTQATNIASNRDIQIGARLDFLYQIQLRFFPLTAETSNVEISDEFPPSVVVHVNGKQVPLPNPIPTNKPGVEPKRPPKPVNITPHCKLSPILPNAINIKWASEYNKTWVVGIWLVMKLTSDDLLDRLKKKGTRDPAYTKALIIEKLNDNDADVATTSLKVTVSCPLGKMRMRVPCRPQTCSHLQCFDAATFLQMNERKPTWNCPVCDSKANYSDLLIDGYFQETLESKDLPEDENDIILEADGSWKPVPKEEEAGGAEAAAAALPDALLPHRRRRSAAHGEGTHQAHGGFQLRQTQGFRAGLQHGADAADPRPAGEPGAPPLRAGRATGDTEGSVLRRRTPTRQQREHGQADGETGAAVHRHRPAQPLHRRLLGRSNAKGGGRPDLCGVLLLRAEEVQRGDGRQ